MLCVAVYTFQQIANFYEDHIKRRDYDYSLLPPHVIANIFSHLNVKELCKASLTCKSWYYASSDPIAIKNVRVNLWQHKIDHTIRPVTALRLQIYGWKKMQYKQYLRKFGKNITDVELCGNISIPRLLHTLLHLSHIRTLAINDDSKFHSQGNLERSIIFTKYKDEILQNLASIKSIDIRTIKRDLTGYQLLIRHCTNLEIMRWQDNFCDMTDYRNDFLLNFLLEPANNPALYKLTELLVGNLDRKQNSEFFEKMIKLELRQLKKLDLAEISSTYYDVMFKEFCKMYSGLESLTITGCNEQHITDICTYMKNLRVFEIHMCMAINLDEILNLKNLEKLCIYRTVVVDDDSLYVLLSNLTTVKKLQLNNVSQKLFNIICENMTNLEELSLTDVETKECELLYRNMLKLKKLSLLFVHPTEIHSSQIRSSPKYNITNLTELVDLYVSCYIPGITPELLNQMPKLSKNIYVYDPYFPFDWGVEIEMDFNDDSEDEDISVNDLPEAEEYNIADFNWCH